MSFPADLEIVKEILTYLKVGTQTVMLFLRVTIQKLIFHLIMFRVLCSWHVTFCFGFVAWPCHHQSSEAETKCQERHKKKRMFVSNEGFFFLL